MCQQSDNRRRHWAGCFKSRRMLQSPYYGSEKQIFFPLMTSDPAHVLHRYDAGLRANFAAIRRMFRSLSQTQLLFCRLMVRRRFCGRQHLLPLLCA